MRAPWPALHAQLIRSTQTLTFHRQFEALRGAEPALARFCDTPALFDALHSPGGAAEARNAILAALVRRAKSEPEPATTLLLLALWPGLDAAYRRLARHFRGEPELLVSEISSRLVAGIRGLDLSRVRRIAATLIRNCRRDIIRNLKRAVAEASTRADLDDDEIVGDERTDPSLGDAGFEHEILRLVRRIRPVTGGDATLVVAVAVLGESQRDAAAVLGLRHDAGRKRYQRSLKRLRAHVHDIF